MLKSTLAAVAAVAAVLALSASLPQHWQQKVTLMFC